MPSQAKAIAGLADIAEAFDLYLFDQWGVIHNGQQLYPEVPETLATLRAMEGKTLLILSNSSKAPDHSRMIMHRLGLDPDIFDHIITSGGHFLDCLRTRPKGFYQHLGHRYYGIHWPEGYSWPSDLASFQAVSDVTQADFMLLTGLDRPLAGYQSLLETARKHQVPMVCANPDLLSPEGGEIKACPGQLADLYQQIGGQVIRHGKPAKELYEIILAQYSCKPERVIAIGDSCHHDIKGANQAGILGWFFYQGIHQAEWQALCAENSEVAAAKMLGDQYGVTIDYFSQGLRW